MTEDDLNAVLHLLAESLYAERARWKALVQMLVEQKRLKGSEEEVFAELDLRADDIIADELLEASIEERARKLKAAWDKLPKQ